MFTVHNMDIANDTFLFYIKLLFWSFTQQFCEITSLPDKNKTTKKLKILKQNPKS